MLKKLYPGKNYDLNKLVDHLWDEEAFSSNYILRKNQVVLFKTLQMVFPTMKIVNEADVNT